MAAATRLRLELLGGFRVLTDSRFAGRAPSARQQELIAFLVLHARRAPVPRQRIAGSLWPESNDAQALTNLRRELHHLRDAWPGLEALIDVGSRTLAWRDDAGVPVDIVAFEQAADRGLAGDRAALHDAARLYQGDLLPDITVEWIETDREQLRQRAKGVLSRLVAMLEQERAYGEAIERAQQLSRLDPLEEQAWCTLMRCHARRGDRATALHLYQQWAAILKRELGAQPSAATRATYREILDLERRPSQSGAAAHERLPACGPPRRVPHAAQRVVRRCDGQAFAGPHPRRSGHRQEQARRRTHRLVPPRDNHRRHRTLLRRRRTTGLCANCVVAEERRPSAHAADARRGLADRCRAPASGVGQPRVPTSQPRFCSSKAGSACASSKRSAQAFRSAAPLVLVLDDLQWADADTIEWLHYFLRSASGSSCLVVATVRAEEEQDNPPLGRLLGQLRHDDLLTTIALGPLDEAATALLAGAVAERTLDEAAQARTFRETEGHPLFIIERGRMELAGQAGTSTGGELSRVQSVVAARLALLSDEARTTAEVAAAVGRDFQFDLLARASDLEEPVLVRALDELWRRHIVRVQADERWDFSHDRIREVAYSGIGPARRRLIHRRIAQGMELLFAGRLDEVSASIAVHLDRGGQPARAVPFLERAAAVATRVSANEEAIRCLNYALSLLETLPATRERDERELAIRSSLSVALNSARGYASLDVEQNLDRVFALSRADGQEQLPVRWLWVAFTLRFMLGDLKGTREASEQALARSARRSLVPVRGAPRHGRHVDERRRARRVARPFRGVAGGVRRAASAAFCARLGPRRVRSRLVLARTVAARRRGPGAEARGSRHRTRAPARSPVQPDARARVCRAPSPDAPRLPIACSSTRKRVVTLCERYGFAYYGDWARVLLGWVHGQEEPTDGIADDRIGAGASRRSTRAGSPAVLPLAARGHVPPCRTDRPRGLDCRCGHRRWRSRGEMRGGCLRCICKRASWARRPSAIARFAGAWRSLTDNAA